MIAIPLAVSDPSFIPVKMGEKFLKTKLSQQSSVGFIENAKKIWKTKKFEKQLHYAWLENKSSSMLGKYPVSSDHPEIRSYMIADSSLNCYVFNSGWAVLETLD